MAKKTLLAIVQDILNDMDSDEVNSINDTIEAQQVAQIVRTTYEELMSGANYWPHLETLMQLTASGDSAKPTHMQMPENVQYLKWIKYNKRTSTDTRDRYSEVSYMEREDFIEYLNQRNSSSSNITTVTDFSGVKLFIKNDSAPSYWTSFDDEWIIFDSHDSVVDSTLQTSKTQALAYREASFTVSDTYTPDLPAKAFPFLIAEAKSVAFNALKQMPNAKEEQRSRRQRNWLSRENWRQNGGIRKVDYGRKGK